MDIGWWSAKCQQINNERKNGKQQDVEWVYR
jgi:hypothetical protein